MSVESEILRIQNNIANTYAAVSEKGGDVPSQPTSENLAAAVASIPVGMTQEDADARYLQLSGGTMTGPMTVQSPIADGNPATKKFLESLITGTSWTNISMPNITRSWGSVAYGNGKFVAVAKASDKTAYSTDGINWTLADLPSSENWNLISYGNGKFVVTIESNKKVAYSTDGINWTEADMGRNNGAWRAFAYGNGKFVAITRYSKAAIYSTDGITWTYKYNAMPSSEQWSGLTYGNGKFVAVADQSDKAAYSTDGINWTETTMPSSARWFAVAYGNGKFMAIASSSRLAAYSTDGINWMLADLPSYTYWGNIAYGNGKFVAVASDYTKAAYCQQFTVPPAFFESMMEKIAPNWLA